MGIILNRRTRFNDYCGYQYYGCCDEPLTSIVTTNSLRISRIPPLESLRNGPFQQAVPISATPLSSNSSTGFNRLRWFRPKVRLHWFWRPSYTVIRIYSE